MQVSLQAIPILGIGFEHLHSFSCIAFRRVNVPSNMPQTSSARDAIGEQMLSTTGDALNLLGRLQCSIDHHLNQRWHSRLHVGLQCSSF